MKMRARGSNLRVTLSKSHSLSSSSYKERHKKQMHEIGTGAIRSVLLLLLL